MELQSYVSQVRTQLETAASLGDERARDVAAALSVAAEPAVRLAIVSALSSAADEITAALLDSTGAPAVSVRLDGDEARFDVRESAPHATEPPPADDAEASARISLRLSESLKTSIEAAARRDAVSVNTWLVRAANSVLSLSDRAGGPTRHHTSGPTQRVTGWING